MKHGTATAYVTGKCRCEDCRTWNRRYNKRLRLEILAGRDRLVDAAPVQAHVRMLLAAGWSVRGITLAAGWKSRNSLRIVMQSTGRINRRTAERLLALGPAGDIRDDGYIDATGSRRRLQALAALGWTSRALAARLGHRDQSTVLNIQNGSVRTIRRRTAGKVRDLYDELSMQVGPSERTRSHARRHGWAPPLAWDDIDDPAERPAGRRDPRQGIAVDDVLELYEAGETVEAIAQRFGIAASSVHTMLGRARRQVAS